MKELKSDTTYDNSDMADWFGLTYNGFKNQKGKKLEELREFADFELLPSGKIHIKDVKRSFYKKRRKKEIKWFQKILTKMIRQNSYQTYSTIAFELKQKYPEETEGLSLRGVADEVQFNLEQMFGEDGIYGDKGEIIWCQQTKEKGLEPINKEQLRFLRNTMIDEYSKVGVDLAINQNQYNFKEISQKEYSINLEKISFEKHKKVMDRFRDRYGFTPIAATKYTLRMIILDNGRKKVLKKEKKRRASIS